MEITAAFPHERKIPRTSSNSSSVTDSLRERAEAPSPSRSGVLGITRITFAEVMVFFAINSSLIPAAIDTITVSSVVHEAIVSRTPSITCGFTARKTYLQFFITSHSLVHDVTPSFSSSASLSKLGSKANTFEVFPASEPRMPLMIAEPIFPAPINPIFVI